MRKTFRLSFYLLYLFLVFSCNRTETTNGYTQKDDFYYKLLSIGDGKLKPDTSDYLLVSAACFTEKDSLFWDTKHDAPGGFYIHRNFGPFAKHLYTMSEGDSLHYLVPTVKFFKGFFGFPAAAFFCEKDSCVKLAVKIERIVSPDEYVHISDSLHALELERKNEEYGQINHYVTQYFNNSINLAADAFMEITAATKGDTIGEGSRIKVLFKGSFLDGRAADISSASKPFEFTMGQEGQVIEGLRRAFCHLKEGEKAKIILPSRLAFGSTGSSDGSIAPYTPLLYEVEIIDVKN